MNFRKSNALESPGFQLAPMIDVVFLLLSFFAFSQLFAHWELDNDIALPTSQSGKTPKRLPGEIILNIKEDGRLTVAGRPLTQADAATAALFMGPNWLPAQSSQAQEAHISIAFASAWTQHEARLKCAREPLVEWSEALAARLAPYRCAPLHGATLRGWCAALAWQASGTVQSL